MLTSLSGCGGLPVKTQGSGKSRRRAPKKKVGNESHEGATT